MTPRCLLGALVLVAVACSSGGESTTTTNSTAETGGPATSTPSTSTPSTTSPATITPSTTPETTLPANEASPATTTSATTRPTTRPTTSPDPTAPATSAATPAPPPATTEPTDLSAAELADQELARSALVTLASFPTGWTEEPDVDDASGIDVEFEDQFDACLGRDDEQRVGDDLERLAVSTGDFQPAGDEATSVTHEVVMAPDVDTAITAMSEVSVDGAETCISDVVQRFYTKTFSEDPDLAGITIGEVTVTRTERERPADVATGVLLEIPLDLEDQTVSQYLEVLYQRQGRALSELSFTSLGTPFSRDGYTVLSDEAAIGLATIGN